METKSLQRLAPPGVLAIVAFLAYSSQYLFYKIEPGPLESQDFFIFNTLVASLLICYLRTWLVDPGRIPRNWHERFETSVAQDEAPASQRQRWCRKCDDLKPPRAHHCKTCGRCIVKMDHHCVWTANCISHITYPHFIRFLIFSVAAMSMLQYFLWQCCYLLWQKKDLPSYLGPTGAQLAHIFALVSVNSIVLLALSLLLARTVWSLLFNMTTIEGWEVERHEALLRRSRVLGGFLYGPDGTKVRIERQEFPWDIGVYWNICEGLGSYNPLEWLWPFASSPSVESGLTFTHNEIEDPRKPWPPPDPDRMFRAPHQPPPTGDGFTQSSDHTAFYQRQAADLARYAHSQGDEYVVRRRPFHERLEALQKHSTGRGYAAYNRHGADDVAVVTDDDEADSGSNSGDEQNVSGARDDTDKGEAGEEGWRTREGDRLADFGVDEVAEFYDEDDVPLAELMKRRRGNVD